MIDRSYLPYQSAREFQDRGMAKWAGFFLSEHTTVLQTKEIDRSQITILEGNQFATYTGSIHTLSASEVLLKSDGHYHRLLVDSIIFIESEETAYETYSD